MAILHSEGSETDELTAHITSSRGVPVSLSFTRKSAQYVLGGLPSTAVIGDDFISKRDRRMLHAQIAMLLDPDFSDIAAAQYGKLKVEPLQSLADF